jgi:acetoin utilization deacetylase AcuC-like enzyme
LYKEFGFVGAYIDLDGHYGNSIEDFKEHSSVSDVVSQSIKFNINPKYNHREYINDLKESLEELKLALLNNEIHYVVFCHGADSHEYDDCWNGNEKGQCTTEEWVECSSIVYSFIRDMKVKYNKDIPLCISLFGGYRQDNYENVLNLHAKDVIQAINIFYNSNIKDKLKITEPDLVFNLV